MASPGRSPASPGMHHSPVANRAHTTPSKTHTPIRLTDPRTKEPIDLHGSEKKTPASSNASIAKGSPVAASPSPVKAAEKPVVNGGSEAPGSPKSPAAAPAAASSGGSSAADKLKEQIKMKLEAERKEKERKEQEQEEQKQKEVAQEEERKKKEEADASAAADAAAAAAKAAEEEKKRAEAAAEEPEKKKDEEEEEQEEVAVETQGKTVSEEEIAAAVASVNDKIKQSTNSPTKTLVNAVNGPQPSIEQVQNFTYPFGVNPPAARSKTKYKYDIPFLLQFQNVVNFPPVENWDERRSIVQQSKDDRRNNSKGPKGGMKNMPMGQSAMGSFQSNAGYRGMGDRSSSMGMGGFGGRGNMNRMSSAGNAGMGGKSGRQGSSRRRGGGGDRSGSNRGGREQSRREEEEKEKAEPAAPPPRSANAWVPRSRQQKAAAEQPVSEDNRLAPELVQRKVKSLLNKMTMENFERISDQILEIAAQSKYEKDGRTLRQVIELTFAKAVDESHWSSMYAQFCMKMLTNVDPEIEDENIKDQKDNPVKGGPLFRKYLLNKCQEEFEQGWSDKLPTNEDGSPLDPELMSDEYYKAVAAKRRGLGLIRFIGELFMLGLLSEKIIHACIGKLCGTDDPSEEVIESLCQLVTTVGKKVDSNPNARRYVDAYFVKMKEFQNQPGLPSRLRFKLMDVADLRSRGWDNKDANKGPMKLAQIHDEAKQKAAEDAARQANRSRGHYRGGGGGHDHSRSNMNMAGDLSKIGRIRSQGSGQTLGPSSMLNREGSGSSRRSNTSSPGAPLSGESSRQPSQRDSQQSSANSSQRANIFEHLTEDSDKPASEAPTTAASSAPGTTTATQNSNASGAEETNAD